MPAARREFSVIGWTCHRWSMKVECYQIPVPLVPLSPQSLGKNCSRRHCGGWAPAWHEGSWQEAPSGSRMGISCDHSLFFKPPRSVHMSLLTGKVPSPLLLLNGGPTARRSLCVKCKRTRFCPCFLAFWCLKFHLPHWVCWGSALLSVSSKKQTAFSSLSFSFLGEMDFLGRENCSQR